MKTSQVLRIVLDSGLYVSGRGVYGAKGESEYLCNATNACFVVGLISREEAVELKAVIRALLAPHHTITLMVMLARTDKAYKWRSKRYGHLSQCCFKIRLAWFEQLAIKLESEGN
jgi:tRNA pseudouridine-54 N-methylase